MALENNEGSAEKRVPLGTSKTPNVQKIAILGADSIHIGYSLADHVVHTLTETLPSPTYVLISDAASNPKVYKDAFLSEETRPSSFRLLSYEVPATKHLKSRFLKADIEDWLLETACTRDTVLLAYGGEALGEMVGFVAATYMRGIRYCQVPTSLLAMIDTAVGGKTGVDTPQAQNAVGAFHLPSYTFIDVALIAGMTEREILSGMAEIVKVAAVHSESLFTTLESTCASIRTVAAFNGDLSNNIPSQGITQSIYSLQQVMQGAITVKAEIVNADPQEKTGLRALLNFGHTVSHALESVLGSTLTHGECVSIGMMLEAELSCSIGCLDRRSLDRLAKCLANFHLPTTLHDTRVHSASAFETVTLRHMLDFVRLDKKTVGGRYRIVLLSAIGKTVDQGATSITDEVLASVLLSHMPSSSTAGISPIGLPYARYTLMATILITGMRGSGKSYMGRMAAESTGMKLIDGDHEIERRLQQPHGEFVARFGWPKFRELETSMLREFIETKPRGYIISLGGGIVETPEARQLMLQWMQTGGPVINVIRNIKETIDYLGRDTARPSLGEPLEEVYARRKPHFEACSSYEVITHIPKYENFHGASSLAVDEAVYQARLHGSVRESHRFFRFITGLAPSDLHNKVQPTTCLVIGLSDLRGLLPTIKEIAKNVDAVEIRVDLLKDVDDTCGEIGPSEAYITYQITQFRQVIELPIIYTVRTKAQGGTLQVEKWENLNRLYSLGIRLGCEYLDVECCWDSHLLEDLVKHRGFTKIIASWTGDLAWDSRRALEIYQRARKFGDVIRISSHANDFESNIAAWLFKKSMPTEPPLIVLNIGEQGRLTQIYNYVLTPVMHPKIEFVQGTLTLDAESLYEARRLLGAYQAFGST